MKLKSILVIVSAALALAVSVAPASATTVAYDWTADGGHSGSFVFDDAATSVGSGPFGGSGVAYDALSFVIDGLAQTNPLLVIYEDIGGNQMAFFTSAAYPYIQLISTGTGLFNSSAASEMAHRSLGDFSSGVLYAFGGGFQLNTMVPEPGTLALLGIGLAGLGFARRRKA